MIEVSCMLNIATENSLIIIDELGRGTSTTEGFGLVKGLCSYLLEHVGAYTFMATHFQELTRLSHPKLANYYMVVEEDNGRILMQYRV
jgi:DNA mismatch repair ATPase MutS